MATTAPTKVVERRVLLRLPIDVGTFLDLMCRLSGRRKRSLVDMVWAEGMRTVFGITPEELAQCSLTIPKQRPPVVKDFHALTNQVCGRL